MSKQSATYTIKHSNIGNLLYRKDNLTNQYENFTYDNLDRLTGISYNGGASQAITYAANGNITSKYGSGSFLYGAKPHAVASVTIYPGPVSQDYQDVTYTPFNKVSNIAQRTPATRKLYTYDITYGPDEQRVKTVYTDTLNAITTRYYAGSYEKEIKGSATRQIHYISGGTGLVAVYIKKNTDSGNLYYVCTDRQGSITALLNTNGTVAERYSYDAWGRRRNPANWNDYNVTAPTLLNRGYTGHEMLDAFGLINMNGRMYDPVIGRILSPDKYVQSPTNTQSYNRYTYCFNNPLKYTDPSGWIAPESDGPEFVWLGGGFGPGPNGSIFGTRGGFGLPGEWINGTGLNGYYYDWVSETYRYTNEANTKVSYKEVYTNAVLSYSPTFNFSDYWDEIKQKQKAFEDKQALAAASNIGYGKSLNDPGDSDGDPPGKNGYVISIANGAIAAGPFGIMGDMGAVSDSYGNVSSYLTIGGVAGFGATYGAGASRTSKNFKLADFAGSSQGLMWQFLMVGSEFYGNSSNTQGMAGIGDKYSGKGLNYGPGFMYAYYYSYTFLFSIPSDFWVRPGKR